jgi:hypothetical protein
MSRCLSIVRKKTSLPRVDLETPHTCGATRPRAVRDTTTKAFNAFVRISNAEPFP